jgi:hypothetical protein
MILQLKDIVHENLPLLFLLNLFPCFSFTFIQSFPKGLFALPEGFRQLGQAARAEKKNYYGANKNELRSAQSGDCKYCVRHDAFLQ